MIVQGLNFLFPTPVLKTKLDPPPGIDTHIIIEYCGEKNKVSAEMLDGNILDDPFLENFRDNHVVPALQEYCNQFNINLKEVNYGLRAWITGYETGYSMPRHNHSGAHISAVFYLFCEEDDGGDIVFHDPRSNANRGYTEQFKPMFSEEKYFPKTNDVLIFPSFLYHNVNRFNGKIRLAMPVDLTIYT